MRTFTLTITHHEDFLGATIRAKVTLREGNLEYWNKDYEDDPFNFNYPKYDLSEFWNMRSKAREFFGSDFAEKNESRTFEAETTEEAHKKSGLI